MSYQDFKELSKDEKLTYLTQLRSESSINDILEQWGITRPVYYNIAHEIGLPLKRKGSSNGNGAKKQNIKRSVHTPRPLASEHPSNDERFSFSIDTSGPVSLVSNVLNLISDLENKQVRVKMDLEVL